MTDPHAPDETADALIEALATTSDHLDPFAQAAAVAEYLYDRGIILARASHSLAASIAHATFWTLTGAATVLILDRLN